MIPGSAAELATLGDNQAEFLEWRCRNRELVRRVASGEVPCCERRTRGSGCELLGGWPVWVDRQGQYRNGCPRQAVGAWLVELLNELNLICEGVIDV